MNNSTGTAPLLASQNMLETLRDIFQVLWKSRWFIVKFTTAIIVLSVTISLILPKSYKSTAILLPQTNQSLLSSLSGLSNLASLTGLSFGQSTMEQLFPDIILSEAVLREVIFTKYSTEKFAQPVNLIEYWEIDGDSVAEQYEITLEKFRKELTVDYDRKTNVVTVELVMREPLLTAEVVNKILSVLDEYIRTKRITNATEQRKWIEQRLKQVQRDLEDAEIKLKDFRERNRIVTMSPQLLLEQQRLLRDVEINTTIFTELKKQYELAKIEELKNIPIINILDPARPAGRKYAPKRAIIVIVSTFLGFLAACGYVYYRQRYHQNVQHYLRSLFQS